MQALIRNLQRDVQQLRGIRTGVIALLFALGLYFWIPLLYHACFGESASSVVADAAAGADATLTDVPKSIVAETSFASPDVELCNSRQPRVSRSAAAGTVVRDPLVQTAEAAAIGSEQFRQAGAPPHVLSDAVPPQKLAETAPAVGPTQGLVLKSTIIGVSRRGAYINRKLYFEGTTIEDNGVTYELTEVRVDRVILKQGNRVVELTADEPLSRTAEAAPESNRSISR